VNNDDTISHRCEVLDVEATVLAAEIYQLAEEIDMAALNKVQFIGNLGRDPEMRFTPTGKKVCHFSLAINSRRGEEEPEWVNVEAWERLGEICQQYLGKGRLAYIEGRLKTDRWTDDKGETHQRTLVVAHNMQILDRKPQDSNEPPTVEDDEMPF